MSYLSGMKTEAQKYLEANAMQARGGATKMDDDKTPNPYTPGSSAYLAWEFGYLAALDDVAKIMPQTDSKEGDGGVDSTYEPQDQDS